MYICVTLIVCYIILYYDLDRDPLVEVGVDARVYPCLNEIRVNHITSD